MVDAELDALVSPDVLELVFDTIVSIVVSSFPNESFERCLDIPSLLRRNIGQEGSSVSMRCLSILKLDFDSVSSNDPVLWIVDWLEVG